jgi:hypothetical protein
VFEVICVRMLLFHVSVHVRPQSKPSSALIATIRSFGPVPALLLLSHQDSIFDYHLVV